MTIGSIASSSFYAGSISAMQGRFAAAGSSGPMAPGGAMCNRPDPVEIFNKMDQDGSGGLDQTEFQTLADRIGEVTGSAVDVAQLFETYDADGDGELSQDETQMAMEANRPEGLPPPPPHGDMMSGVGGMSGSGPDFSQMFTGVKTEASLSNSSSAIDNYLKMAALSLGQDQGSNWPVMFSGQNAFSADAALFSVNTRV